MVRRWSDPSPGQTSAQVHVRVLLGGKGSEETAKQQSSKAVIQQSRKATKQQSSKAAILQNSKTAKQQEWEKDPPKYGLAFVPTKAKPSQAKPVRAGPARHEVRMCAASQSGAQPAISKLHVTSGPCALSSA